jgi:hypothetical protein
MSHGLQDVTLPWQTTDGARTTAGLVLVVTAADADQMS